MRVSVKNNDRSKGAVISRIEILGSSPSHRRVGVATHVGEIVGDAFGW